MPYNTYEDYQRLQNAFMEKYHFNQESLRLILIGPFGSAGFFRKSSDWSNPQRQEKLKRIDEYLNDPFTLFDDIHCYLHNEKNGFIPYLKSAVFHENPDNPEELIPVICFDDEEESEAKWKKKLKNDIHRVYHWFEPKYDEKNGGLVPYVPYLLIMKEALVVYKQKTEAQLERLNELISLLAQTEDAATAHQIITEISLLSDEIQELPKKMIYYFRYAASPEIVTIVWQHFNTFAPIFSKKLTRRYHWNQATSIQPSIRRIGLEYIERMNLYFERRKQSRR